MSRTELVYMSERERLQRFREASLREEAERLKEFSGAETLEHGLRFSQFAVEVSKHGAD